MTDVVEPELDDELPEDEPDEPEGDSAEGPVSEDDNDGENGS